MTNHSGTVEIYSPKGRTDNTAISRKGSTLNVGGAVDVFDVAAIEIDKYIDNAISPNLRNNILLVKIDTQGHELSVLRGMKKFLSNPPSEDDLGGWSFVVIAEYDRRLQEASGHGPNEMLDFMRNLGYEVRCHVSENEPVLRPAIPLCRNVIFSKGKPVRGAPTQANSSQGPPGEGVCLVPVVRGQSRRGEGGLCNQLFVQQLGASKNSGMQAFITATSVFHWPARRSPRSTTTF